MRNVRFVRGDGGAVLWVGSNSVIVPCDVKETLEAFTERAIAGIMDECDARDARAINFDERAAIAREARAVFGCE